MKQAVILKIISSRLQYKVMAKGLFRLCCGRSFSRSQMVNTEESFLAADHQLSYDSTLDYTHEGTPGENQSASHPKLRFAGHMLHLIHVEDTFYGELERTSQ